MKLETPRRSWMRALAPLRNAADAANKARRRDRYSIPAQSIMGATRDSAINGWPKWISGCPGESADRMKARLEAEEELAHWDFPIRMFELVSNGLVLVRVWICVSSSRFPDTGERAWNGCKEDVRRDGALFKQLENGRLPSSRWRVHR